jgi:hypothetical protein
MHSTSVSILGRAPWLAIALATAVAARLGAFVVLQHWPVYFNPYKANALRTRRLGPDDVVGIDIEQYIAEAERWADGTFLQALHDYSFGDSVVPPLTPWLLWLFDYGPDHTLPLALFWMAMSALWAVGWTLVLARKGLAGPWLLLPGLLPTPVFYQFAVGTDLPFALLFLAFYAVYGPSTRGVRTWSWMLALILLLLTRSSALAVVAYVGLDLMAGWWRGQRPPFGNLIAIGAIGIAGAVVHLSWLFDYMVHSVPGGALIDPYTFFGFTEAEYRAGLFGGQVPAWLDVPLSMGALALAKTLYFCGLRPSFETPSAIGLAARTLSALAVAIPGLVWCLLKGDTRDRLLVALFLAPALAGLAQERYNLPILPLLTYYAALSWQSLGERLARLRGPT